jgi:hypothetical protein
MKKKRIPENVAPISGCDDQVLAGRLGRWSLQEEKGKPKSARLPSRLRASRRRPLEKLVRQPKRGHLKVAATTAGEEPKIGRNPA